MQCAWSTYGKVYKAQITRQEGGGVRYSALIAVKETNQEIISVYFVERN